MADSDECKKVKEVDDSARTLFGALLSAASIAAAAYNTYRAVSIAMDEYELACRYWYLAEGWLNLYQDLYAPVEDVEAEEATNLKEIEPNFQIMQGRARVSALYLFRGKIRPELRKTKRYCTGRREDIIVRLAQAAASACAVSTGLGYRNERAYLEADEETRFKKLLSVAKRGRNMVANNVSFAQAVGGIYGQMADQAWAGITGAGSALGYLTNRQETRVPQTFVSYNDPQAGESLLRSMYEEV